LRLITAAVLSTALIIALGFFIISPLFYRTSSVETKQKIMLSFSASESNDIADWCRNLSSILKSYDISATLFIVGKVAEQHPECVSCFSSKVDIGSQTYSNLNLTSIADYDTQLEEVRKGKQVVDTAGNLYSRVFRAPNGDTDQNIYSLLSRNDILADFSYGSQYNVYLDNQFVKFDATVYDGTTCSANSILTLKKSSKPIIINFDNEYPAELISDFIGTLKTGQLDFVNASEMTGLNLTVRGD
jgi:peptidoglycan/xylan/chitin deacetylase (PgdA/CDA1 family)